MKLQAAHPLQREDYLARGFDEVFSGTVAFRNRMPPQMQQKEGQALCVTFPHLFLGLSEATVQN